MCCCERGSEEASTPGTHDAGKILGPIQRCGDLMAGRTHHQCHSCRGDHQFPSQARRLYGSSNKDYPIEFMGFGLRAIGRMPKLKLKKLGKEDKNPRAALKGERNAFFEESRGFVKTKIYDGDKLGYGNVLEGPCIVEEDDQRCHPSEVQGQGRSVWKLH